MQILEIKVLKGPNYWSIRRPNLIQMKLDLEDLEYRPSNKTAGILRVADLVLNSRYPMCLVALPSVTAEPCRQLLAKYPKTATLLAGHPLPE